MGAAVVLLVRPYKRVAKCQAAKHGNWRERHRSSAYYRVVQERPPRHARSLAEVKLIQKADLRTCRALARLEQAHGPGSPSAAKGSRPTPPAASAMHFWSPRSAPRHLTRPLSSDWLRSP